MNLESPINYKITDDGACSHCGQEAELNQTPDGDVVRSIYCESCDEHNLMLTLSRRSGQPSEVNPNQYPTR